MRIKLNLDLPPASGRSILIHGLSNAGKTFMGGAHLLGEGKALFLNLKGEDGTRSLMSLGLGEVAETVETLADLKDLVKDYVKAGLERLTVDSLKYIWAMAIEKVCGAGNLPKTGTNNNDWTQIHHEATRVLNDLLDLAPSTVFLSPSDRSMDQVKQTPFVTPDLPGRMATGVASVFDAVGYLEADAIANKVRRQLHFEPMTGVITKLRSAQQLKKPIVLPEGPGCWGEVIASLLEAGA